MLLGYILSCEILGLGSTIVLGKQIKISTLGFEDFGRREEGERKSMQGAKKIGGGGAKCFLVPSQNSQASDNRKHVFPAAFVLSRLCEPFIILNHFGATSLRSMELLPEIFYFFLDSRLVK